MKLVTAVLCCFLAAGTFMLNVKGEDVPPLVRCGYWAVVALYWVSNIAGQLL